MEKPLRILTQWVAATTIAGAIAPASNAAPDSIAKQVSASQACAGNQLTPAEVQEILSIHNRARSEIGVPPLTWNCKLADYAQQWVNRDVFEHSSSQDLNRILPGRKSGENLAAAAPATQPIATVGPTDWLQEKRYWNNKMGMCKSGKTCSHYTQVVWRATTQIGCGVNRQSSVMGGQWRGNSVYLACVYNPAGNLVQRDGRMKPY